MFLFLFVSGDYITGDISDEYLEHLHAMRNDTTLAMNSMRMLSVSSRCEHFAMSCHDAFCTSLPSMLHLS